MVNRVSEIFFSPFFGITLSIIAFELGLFINRKTKLSILNPYLISVFICILIMVVFDIPLEAYQKGGNVIAAFLGPATAVLAVSMYRQMHLLKKYIIPIVAGCFTGALTSWISVSLLSRVFNIPDVLTFSLLPKSVSTPFAIVISEKIGGIPSLTVAAVAVTGIFGGVFGPMLARLYRIKNPLAIGVAIGASSHAIGTSRAIELGDIQGAMSGVALCVTGIITVILSLIL